MQASLSVMSKLGVNLHTFAQQEIDDAASSILTGPGEAGLHLLFRRIRLQAARNSAACPRPLPRQALTAAPGVNSMVAAGPERDFCNFDGIRWSLLPEVLNAIGGHVASDDRIHCQLEF